MRCSSSATRFFSAGSCRKTADDFSQSRFAMAGYPETNAPASTEFGMPVCAVATTPLPMRQVARDAHLPRQHHVVVDRRAAGDADLRGEQRPAADRHAVRDLHEVVDLGARADARLADRGPIDRRVRADLHVVFDDDVGVLRDLGCVPSGRLTKPKPSLPMTAPFWTTTRWPTTTRSRIETCECRTQSSPMRAPGPTTTFG